MILYQHGTYYMTCDQLICFEIWLPSVLMSLFLGTCPTLFVIRQRPVLVENMFPDSPADLTERETVAGDMRVMAQQ